MAPYVTTLLRARHPADCDARSSPMLSVVERVWQQVGDSTSALLIQRWYVGNVRQSGG